jgi:hypothetical protein
MSDPESESKFKYVEKWSVPQRAMLELALDFIDSEVVGGIEMTCDEVGLSSIKVTRHESLVYATEVGEEPEDFSPEFVREQMNLDPRITNLRLFTKGDRDVQED